MPRSQGEVLDYVYDHDGKRLRVGLVDASGNVILFTNYQYVSDGAGSPGADYMTIAGGFRKDVIGSFGDTDGDRVAVQLDAEGQLRVVTAATIARAQFGIIANNAKTRTVDIDANSNLQVALGTAIVNSIDSISAFDATNSVMNGLTALTPGFQAFGVATSGNNIIRTNPNAGKKIRVLSFFGISTAANNIYFTSDTGGTAIFGNGTNKIGLAANGGFVLPYNKVGWFETAADHDLVVNMSAATAFAGGFTYIEI
jgi:hypothetical protein